MKKIILGLSLAILLGATTTLAYKVTQLESYEYTGSINYDGTPVKIYTVDQEKATCYVVVSKASSYSATLNTGISCIAK